MKCTFNYFKNSTKYAGRTIINVSVEAVDDVTGVTYSQDRHYLLWGDVYLKPFIGKQVEIALTKSPKLGFDVCTDIKFIPEEVTPATPVELF